MFSRTDVQFQSLSYKEDYKVSIASKRNSIKEDNDIITAPQEIELRKIMASLQHESK